MMVKIKDSLVGEYYVFVSAIQGDRGPPRPEDLPPHEDVIPVLISSNLLAGLRHIAAAASATLYSMSKRKSRFRDPVVEMVVRLTGERQVSVALKKALEGEICLILVSRSSKAIEDYRALLEARGVVLGGKCRFAEPRVPEDTGCGSGDCEELTFISDRVVSLFEK